MYRTYNGYQSLGGLTRRITAKNVSNTILRMDPDESLMTEYIK